MTERINYKEKYEQALERMKSWMNGEYPECFTEAQKAAEFIFPELKESKEEWIKKIRQELISYLGNREVKQISESDAILQWIAWLEKQGEKERDEWKEGNIIRHGGILAFVIKGRRAIKSNGEIFTVQYPDEWVKASPNEIEHFFNNFEKQGSTNVFDVPEITIKDAVEVTSRMQYIENDMKPIAEFIIDYANWNLHKDEWNRPTITVPLFRVLDALIQRGKPYCENVQNVEKQEGQKQKNESTDTCDSLSIKSKEFPASGKRDFGYFSESADKIEPKFHEGEWIVWQDKCYKVNFNGCRYELIDQNGLSTSLEYVTIDENAHLWTIANAKEGDVLACPLPKSYEPGEQIFIFKGINSRDYVDNCIEYYCRICEGVFYENKNGGYMGTTSTPLYPATKYQRDTLEKAMRNAGWEFDFEKKELKKLTQQEVTKISDQEKDFIEIPFGAKDSEFIEDTYFIPEGCYAVIVDDTVVIKKGEKPTTWNEEDEDMLNFCCDYLDTPQATWLQTLKQRIGG